MTAGPHLAEGVCIVCGSAMVLALWRGHPENRKVHCNHCGSEVTALMHAKNQPTEKLIPKPCPFCGSKNFDEPHDSSNTQNHFGPPDIVLWHEDGCWLGGMTIIKLGPYEPGVSSNHVAVWNKRPFRASSSPVVDNPQEDAFYEKVEERHENL